jgi:ABC-type transport system involved in multi-copper enzyme maturation permease subunit
VEKYVALVAIVLAVLVPALMIALGWRNPIMRRSSLATLAFPNSVSAVRAGVSLFGPFLAAALGANIVGAEYQFNTWPWLLVRSTSRLQIVIVKTLTVAARVVTLTVLAVAAFVATAAFIRAVTGNDVATGSTTIGGLLIPLLPVAGAMAFAAVVGMAVTVATRSVAFGTLSGSFMLPVLSAIRFKETAVWIPYVHLQNIEERLLYGRPTPILERLYEFSMSGRASAAIVGVELLVLLAIAYAIFRRQEIVY